jgi:anti-anti-sigma regulatory factor
VETVVMDSGVTVLELGRSYSHTEPAEMTRLSELLDDLAGRADPPLLLVDMTRTVLVNSELIGRLLAAHRTLANRGGHMAVCSSEAFYSDQLRIMKLDTLWGSHNTRREGIDALLAAYRDHEVDG